MPLNTPQTIPLMPVHLCQFPVPSPLRKPPCKRHFRRHHIHAPSCPRTTLCPTNTHFCPEAKPAPRGEVQNQPCPFTRAWCEPLMVPMQPAPWRAQLVCRVSRCGCVTWRIWLEGEQHELGKGKENGICAPGWVTSGTTLDRLFWMSLSCIFLLLRLCLRCRCFLPGGGRLPSGAVLPIPKLGPGSSCPPRFREPAWRGEIQPQPSPISIAPASCALGYGLVLFQLYIVLLELMEQLNCCLFTFTVQVQAKPGL